MQNYAWPSLCLDVADLDVSRRFYEACGFETVPEDSAAGLRVVLRAGGFRLGLFRGIAGNSLNLRGADVARVRADLLARYPDMPGELDRYVPDDRNRADASGTAWFTQDPDGNAVFFDTNECEQGDAHRARRITRILRDTARELERAGASAACLEAFRSGVLDRFANADRDAG